MIYDSITPNLGFPNSSVGKSLQWRRPWFDSWAGKIPWRRERLPTPVFWPGNSMDCTVCGVAKSWTWLSDFHFHFSLSTPNFETVYLLYSFAVANWIWTHLYLVTTKAETMISLINLIWLVFCRMSLYQSCYSTRLQLGVPGRKITEWRASLITARVNAISMTYHHWCWLSSCAEVMLATLF